MRGDDAHYSAVDHVAGRVTFYLALRPCYLPSLDPLVRVQPRMPALAVIMCVCENARMPIWRRYRADAPVTAASASVHLYLCVCACACVTLSQTVEMNVSHFISHKAFFGAIDVVLE